MKNKFISTILTLVIILSLVPMTAFAAENAGAHAHAPMWQNKKPRNLLDSGVFDIILQQYQRLENCRGVKKLCLWHSFSLRPQRLCREDTSVLLLL